MRTKLGQQWFFPRTMWEYACIRRAAASFSLVRTGQIYAAILLLIFIAIPALRQPVWAEAEIPGQLQQGAALLQPVVRADDDLLILEVRLGSFILSEGMIGYLTASGLLLPLGDFTGALDFSIAVEPENGRADGWFLREERIFSLDVINQEVIVESQRKSYPAALVELQEDDIFVDTRLLSRWFPIDVRFDLTSLTVNVASREPLPLEQRLAREKRRGRVLSRRLADQPDFPLANTPYQPVSWPFIDTSIDMSHFKDEDDKTTTARYSTVITGDLAYMSANIFLTGNDRDRLTDARLTLSRKDPDGKLLGPLALTEVVLGDVAAPQLPLISRSKFGRGVTISSFPLDRSSEFDRTTIRGELPLGWEAELFRNEVLLDFQQSRADGRYEFIDVPLLFGHNVLRVELFGPQGQTRQDIRRFLVGPGLVAPGEWNMRAGLSQQDKNLLPVEDDTIDVENKLEGKVRFLAEVERGIAQDFSVGAVWSSLPLDSGRRNYANLNTRFVLDSVYSRLDLVGDSEGGWGVNAAVQTRLPGGINLSVEHGEFRDFISEQIDDITDTLKSRSKMRLDGVFSLGDILRVPATLAAKLDRSESGLNQAEINNRLSTSLAGVSLSNDLNTSLVWGSDDSMSTLSGNFLIGGWLGDVSLRGELGYNLVPDAELARGSLTGVWFIENDFTAHLGVNSQITDPSATTYTFGLSRLFESVSLGANLDYEDDGSLAARLTMSFAIGREPRKGTWQIGSRPIANSGAVSARVFLDNNASGKFEAEEDTPLEGVRFDANRGRIGRTATNAEGIAFLTGITPNRRSGVAVSERTLEDPYWVSQTEGVTIVPRPGIVTEIDFPIVSTGEIDGTVYQLIGSSTPEVSDVAVQLLDQEGNVVKTVRSAYDGFYLFDFVPPGHYSVRIDPDQMARLNLAPPSPTDIVIGGNQEIISGLDLVVMRISAPGQDKAIDQPEPCRHRAVTGSSSVAPAAPPSGPSGRDHHPPPPPPCGPGS